MLPIDDPPDRLYGLIVHELTHQFEFDIIPQGLIRRSVPLWVNEGLSDYERGQWEPLDLMTVRDAAVADIVPKMSELEGYGNTSNPRLIYNLGHAVFEFIEAKFGKEGIRQFLFALRKSVIGGGEDAYEEALRMKPDEFDQAFERYLKDRFKPFRDKERPADYGRDLSPNQEKTHYAEALSIAPSPSGDLIAAVTVNRKDRELDIVLISSKDGSIVRNLTERLRQGHRLRPHRAARRAFDTMPWMAWSPKGDRLAYFVRTEKERTLIIQNVLTAQDRRADPDEVGRRARVAELLARRPDDRVLGAARRHRRHLHGRSRDQGRSPTSPNDDFADYGADLLARRQVPRLQRARQRQPEAVPPRSRHQEEDAAHLRHAATRPRRSSSTTTRWCSRRRPPIRPCRSSRRSRRTATSTTSGRSTCKNGELRQYTDALGGNWSPIVLNDGKTNRIAFVSYYKGEYGIHTLERKEPLHTAATADFGAPGPIIDFQAPLQHTLVAANAARRRARSRRCSSRAGRR